jgi:hypothetical protein
VALCPAIHGFIKALPAVTGRGYMIICSTEDIGLIASLGRRFYLLGVITSGDIFQDRKYPAISIIKS